MNRKHVGCKVEGCTRKHKGHGYCATHLDRSKKGTLERYPCSHLCNVEGCFSKRYCNGYCVKHYQRDKKNLPMNLEYGTKNHYLRGDYEYEHKDKDSFAPAVKQALEDKCMVCGWNKAPCDVHHIVGTAFGGKNILLNAVVLCPNCHRLAHNGGIGKEELTQIIIKNIDALKEENKNVSLVN